MGGEGRRVIQRAEFGDRAMASIVLDLPNAVRGMSVHQYLRASGRRGRPVFDCTFRNRVVQIGQSPRDKSEEA